MSGANGKRISLGELARRIGGELVGDADRMVGGVRPFEAAGADDLTFLDPKNRAWWQRWRAAGPAVSW